MNPDVKELSFRRSASHEISLVWNARSRRVWISVLDTAAETRTSAPVAVGQAGDAFAHPFFYLRDVAPAKARPATSLRGEVAAAL